MEEVGRVIVSADLNWALQNTSLERYRYITLLDAYADLDYLTTAWNYIHMNNPNERILRRSGWLWRGQQDNKKNGDDVKLGSSN
jgi:hypothetical protein